MPKLTVDQFTEQVNNSNLEYALSADIITDYTADKQGIVIEDEEEVLCTGEAIYNFMFASSDFDGVFDAADVQEHIGMMLEMS